MPHSKWPDGQASRMQQIISWRNDETRESLKRAMNGEQQQLHTIIAVGDTALGNTCAQGSVVHLLLFHGVWSSKTRACVTKEHKLHT